MARQASRAHEKMRGKGSLRIKTTGMDITMLIKGMNFCHKEVFYSVVGRQQNRGNRSGDRLPAIEYFEYLTDNEDLVPAGN
jgi:hypothetical protein